MEADGSSDDEEMQVTVRSMMGQPDRPVHVRRGGSVRDLKMAYSLLTDMEPSHQRFVYAGAALADDDRPLSSYGVREGAVVTLSLALLSGPRHPLQRPLDTSGLMVSLLIMANSGDLAQLLGGDDERQPHDEPAIPLPRVSKSREVLQREKEQAAKTKRKADELKERLRRRRSAVSLPASPLPPSCTSQPSVSSTLLQSAPASPRAVSPSTGKRDEFAVAVETEVELDRARDLAFVDAAESPSELRATQRNGGKRKRCAVCHRRLSLVDALAGHCRCDNTFCSAHRGAESHLCYFDYKADGRRRLALANPRVNSECRRTPSI